VTSSSQQENNATTTIITAAAAANNNNNNNNNNRIIAENWYSHIPKPVTEHEDVTVFWNKGIQTDREVLANRPDIIIKNKKDKTCFLVDVAIPSDKNVIQRN
jgi:hypothetical protein